MSSLPAMYPRLIAPILTASRSRQVTRLCATESRPRRLQVHKEQVVTGDAPTLELQPGQAVAIATGGMLPRGADAVVMVENTQLEKTGTGPVSARWNKQDSSEQEPKERDRSPFFHIAIDKPVAPGTGISFAGTDIGAGETVLRVGMPLTSRETGVLAAIGLDRITVYRRPRVAILSTGDELVAPGAPLSPGQIYDSNATILADAVRELGGEPHGLGIVNDELERLRKVLSQAIAEFDVVLLSGGTSKGAGDLSYQAVRELTDPGVVAHGVALKPGKPICLAATHGKPVVILPGFPTSAIFTFHEFVAPIIRELAGQPIRNHPRTDDQVSARLAIKTNSAIGRTEYCLVSLVPTVTDHALSDDEDHYPTLAAYPLGKGSGSVTTFSHADGFVTVGRHEEIVEAGTMVRVRLLSGCLEPADLIAIGSHCIGLDLLLGLLEAQGYRTKTLHVGSMGGVAAALRGECDLAGVHVLDVESQQYNQHLLTDQLDLLSGYGRLQGIVFRPDDTRFRFTDGHQAMTKLPELRDCRMVNRNAGSGTRILVDQWMHGRQPPGYWVQAKSHNAVVSAVAVGNADWGVAIEPVARHAGLGFLPLTDERYDFLIPKNRAHRPAARHPSRYAAIAPSASTTVGPWPAAVGRNKRCYPSRNEEVRFRDATGHNPKWLAQFRHEPP